MAVVCKDIEVLSDYNVKYKDVYKYEVLGGNHTLVAKTQLTTEYPENPFFKTATAEVYVGLTDEESLRLAQRHNLNSHFVHKVTHRDMVSYIIICTTFPGQPDNLDYNNDKDLLDVVHQKDSRLLQEWC